MWQKSWAFQTTQNLRVLLESFSKWRYHLVLQCSSENHRKLRTAQRVIQCWRQRAILHQALRHRDIVLTQIVGEIRFFLNSFVSNPRFQLHPNPISAQTIFSSSKQNFAPMALSNNLISPLPFVLKLDISVSFETVFIGFYFCLLFLFTFASCLGYFTFGCTFNFPRIASVNY